MLPADFSSRPFRPPGEMVKPSFGSAATEAETLGSWHEHERQLNEMASANLDKPFLDEMRHVDQWFRFLSEAERTATIYTLLQHSSHAQARFFISLLQPMSKPVLRTLDQDTSVAEAKLASELAYKTGQVVSRPSPSGPRRAPERHSYAGDYNRLLEDLMGGGGSISSNSNSSNNNSSSSKNHNNTNDVSSAVPKVSGTSNYTGNSLREDAAALGSAPSYRHSLADAAPGRSGSQFGNRPRSVIEGDLFSSWRSMIPMASLGDNGSSNSPSSASKRAPGVKLERPKSEILSAWSFDRPNIPGTVPEGVLPDSLEPIAHRRQSNTVPPSTVASRSTSPSPRKHLAPPGMEKHYGYFTETHQDSGVERGYTSDHSETSTLSGTTRNHRRSSAVGAPSTSRAAKDKKAVEVVDMELLKDVPAWFRSLRLHKYNNIFESMKWQDIIELTDDDLQQKGVTALGARRKMLKVFDNIKAHRDTNFSVQSEQP